MKLMQLANLYFTEHAGWNSVLPSFPQLRGDTELVLCKHRWYESSVNF